MALLLPLAATTVQAAEQKRILRVPVQVPDGIEVTALKAENFSASLVSGPPAKVLGVQSPEDDLLLMIVLDLVGDLALVDPARTALASEFRRLPRKTWITLLRAQDGLQVIEDPTPDRERLAAALHAMPVTGKAGLLTTVDTAVGLADSVASKSAVRVAVLYVTDSDVTNYREDFTNPVINSSDSRDLSRRFADGLIREKISKLSGTLSELQAPVSIVHLAWRTDRLNQAYQSGLMQLASDTGGTALFCRSQADIPGTIAKSLAALQTQHFVQIEIPERTGRTANILLQSTAGPLSYRSRFRLR